MQPLLCSRTHQPLSLKVTVPIPNPVYVGKNLLASEYWELARSLSEWYIDFPILILGFIQSFSGREENDLWEFERRLYDTIQESIEDLVTDLMDGDFDDDDVPVPYTQRFEADIRRLEGLLHPEGSYVLDITQRVSRLFNKLYRGVSVPLEFDLSECLWTRDNDAVHFTIPALYKPNDLHGCLFRNEDYDPDFYQSISKR
jgi:hypothetical protein